MCQSIYMCEISYPASSFLTSTCCYSTLLCAVRWALTNTTQSIINLWYSFAREYCNCFPVANLWVYIILWWMQTFFFMQRFSYFCPLGSGVATVNIQHTWLSWFFKSCCNNGITLNTQQNRAALFQTLDKLKSRIHSYLERTVLSQRKEKHHLLS